MFMPVSNDSLSVAINEVNQHVMELQPSLIDIFFDWFSFVASVATLVSLFFAIRDFKTVKSAVEKALQKNNMQIKKSLHLVSFAEAIGYAERVIEDISHGNYSAAYVRLQHLNRAVLELIENSPYVEKQVLSDYQIRISSDIYSLICLSEKPEIDLYADKIIKNVQHIHDELKKAESKQINITTDNDTSR